MKLGSGAEGRSTNPGASQMVVCVNGGQGNEVPGTWSATLEWLVGCIAAKRSRCGGPRG